MHAICNGVQGRSEFTSSVGTMRAPGVSVPPGTGSLRAAGADARVGSSGGGACCAPAAGALAIGGGSGADIWRFSCFETQETLPAPVIVGAEIHTETKSEKTRRRFSNDETSVADPNKAKYAIKSRLQRVKP